MILAAMTILCAAVALGSIVAAWFLRGAGARPPRLLAITHGAVGVVGTGALLLALQGPPRGVAMGVGAFGTLAAGLLMAAILVGIAIPLLARRRVRAMSGLIAVHAGAAITAYVLLLAWASLG